MKKNFIQIKYKISFDTPFHLGTGLPNGLIDRGIARDANGHLYVPGSTIKGVLRERCEQLAKLLKLDDINSPHDEKAAWNSFNEISIVERIFGNRFYPGEIYFENATMSDEWKSFFKDDCKNNQGKNYKEFHKNSSARLQTETRTQTSVSRILGAIRQKALYQSEFGIRNLTFEGNIYGHLTGVPLAFGEGLYSMLLLIMALQSCCRLGANSSTGMGKYSIEITSLKIDSEDKSVETLFDEFEDDLEYYELAKEEELA